MIEFITEKFSGPLALLLSLIEKEELDITEINLAKIADQYVSYIKNNNHINSEEMADFLLIAAKLLFAKSKALLPYLYTNDDDDDLGDLEKQLRMYQEFVAASQKITKIISKKQFLFLPPITKNYRHYSSTAVFFAPGKLTVNNLEEQFKIVLARLAARVEKKLPEKKLLAPVNIEEKISLIRKLLVDKIKVNFSKLLLDTKDKAEIVISFLAVLELVKQKELIFEQLELFSDIQLTRNI